MDKVQVTADIHYPPPSYHPTMVQHPVQQNLQERTVQTPDDIRMTCPRVESPMNYNQHSDPVQPSPRQSDHQTSLVQRLSGGAQQRSHQQQSQVIQLHQESPTMSVDQPLEVRSACDIQQQAMQHATPQHQPLNSPVQSYQSPSETAASTPLQSTYGSPPIPCNQQQFRQSQHA
jgi:hypothetical protein